VLLLLLLLLLLIATGIMFVTAAVTVIVTVDGIAAAVQVRLADHITYHYNACVSVGQLAAVTVCFSAQSIRVRAFYLAFYGSYMHLLARWYLCYQRSSALHTCQYFRYRCTILREVADSSATTTLYTSSGSQAAAVAVAAAAAVLDTDDDIREALSQLYLGNSRNGHNSHTSQQVGL
jgi:hypothetical protein